MEIMERSIISINNFYLLIKGSRYRNPLRE
nr:MAG TPA: hypothetical protein [Caudoviricetes sp.]